MPDSIIYVWGVWLFLLLAGYLVDFIKIAGYPETQLNIGKSCFQLLVLTILGAVVGHFI